jgi:predicted Zn-dependent protease
MEVVPIILVVVLAGFVLTGSARTSRQRRARRAVPVVRDTSVTETELSQEAVRPASAMDGSIQVAPPAEMRRRVSNLAAGTYINDILSEQDSTLFRWPDGLSNALRVYVEPTATAPNWKPEYPQTARDVFAEWSEAGFPLHFSFVADSSTADIMIRWTDRFPPEDGQRIGVTERVQSSMYMISRARVTIATQDSTGHPLSPNTVGGIIRHEVGHALGLNHANDPTSVMYHEAATSQIGASDRATLRLLYLVPGGTLRI